MQLLYCGMTCAATVFDEADVKLKRPFICTENQSTHTQPLSTLSVTLSTGFFTKSLQCGKNRTQEINKSITQPDIFIPAAGGGRRPRGRDRDQLIASISQCHSSLIACLPSSLPPLMFDPHCLFNPLPALTQAAYTFLPHSFSLIPSLIDSSSLGLLMYTPYCLSLTLP